MKEDVVAANLANLRQSINELKVYIEKQNATVPKPEQSVKADSNEKAIYTGIAKSFCICWNEALSVVKKHIWQQQPNTLPFSLWFPKLIDLFKQKSKLLEYLYRHVCDYNQNRMTIETNTRCILKRQDEILAKINETAAFLKEKGVEAPEFGLILGSGLGELAEEIDNPVVVDYAEIPNWGRSTVVGHAGKLVYGELAGRKVLALQGRFHFYEGNPLEVVTFPVRVMKVLGCEGVIVTNAAGGIGFGPGTLMAITDHINMTGQNPLIGENLDDFGPRFPDMSKAYTPEYRATAHAVAEKLGVKLDDGVYIGVTGPTYETPAEIRAYKTLGADAVGMSTVPEVIVAAHSGLKVLGISCITNFAAGFQEELNHEEVVEVTERVKGDFKGLLKAILAELKKD